MRSAVKLFEYEGESQKDYSYKITVYHRGKVVDTFQAPTMQGTFLLFSNAGYYEKDRS